MSRTVYLSGPITSTLDCHTWRQKFSAALEKIGVASLDPTRRPPFTSKSPTSEWSRELVEADLKDIDLSDLLVVNLQGLGTYKAWGTICELAHAYYLDIPAIVVVDPGMAHPFVDTYATHKTTCLDVALDMALEHYGTQGA